MTCVDENWLVEFAEGVLPPRHRAAVQAHVDGCSSCRQLVSEVARSHHTLQALPPPAPVSVHPPRGSLFGRYVVLDVLGAGGMGVVYAAYDPDLDRRVALKLVHQRLLAGENGAEARSRLLREAQAMARLAHPHVLSVHDVGEVNGQLFIAMELVDGGRCGSGSRRSPAR